MEEKHSIRNNKDFFNDDEVFEKYLEHRRRPENPNECIEKPIILDLLEGMRGRVLDIGCGYGDIAESLLENGMSHYTGIDSSQRMIDLAKSTINNPNADFKVYLTAKSLNRAERRSKEEGIDLEQIVAKQAKRDQQDQTRATAPLQVPEHAYIVDTSEMDLQEVVEHVVRLIRENLSL